MTDDTEKSRNRKASDVHREISVAPFYGLKKTQGQECYQSRQTSSVPTKEEAGHL
jgi:hypothetical protein